jgi:death-on-curing protein
MICVDDVLFIHHELIKRYGGTLGVRDNSLLKSALSHPFSTYDKTDLYPTTIEKATALIESIIINHPFIDGNKRTGYFLFRAYLLEHNMDIHLSTEEKYKFVIDIASGKLKGEALVSYVQKNVVKK